MSRALRILNVSLAVVVSVCLARNPGKRAPSVCAPESATDR